MLKIVLFCVELEQTKMWTQVVHLTSWSRELYLSNRMCELCLALNCSSKWQSIVFGRVRAENNKNCFALSIWMLDVNKGKLWFFWELLWFLEVWKYIFSTFKDDVNSMRRTVMVYLKRWWCFISLCFQYEPDSFKKWVRQQLLWKKRGPTIGMIRKLFAGL